MVAAAAILDPATLPKSLLERLDDSKKLNPKIRETLFGELQGQAAIGVGMADIGEIDTINILQATLLAMRRALDNLPLSAGFRPGGR